MSADLNINATNSVVKGTAIYEKGEPLQSVSLILKGRVTVRANGVRMVMGSGNFLGMCDVETEIHSFTYAALDDLSLYTMPVNNVETAYQLLEGKTQYRGLLVTSQNFFISDLYRIFSKLKTEAESLEAFIADLYKRYLKLRENSGFTSEHIASVDRMLEKKVEAFSLPPRLEYFLQCAKIGVEAQKNYYGASAYVAKEQFDGQCQMIPVLLEGARHYSEVIYRFFRAMSMEERNLFSMVGKLAMEAKRARLDDEDISGILDELLGKINETEKLLTDVAGIDPNLDRARMEEVYFALLSDDVDHLEAYEKEDLQILDQSLQQILEYAPLHMKVKSEFEEAVEAFLGLTDKFSKAPEAAAVRKKVTAGFFEVYYAVVKRSFEDDNPPLAVKLFLRYGYVSEELLTADELKFLVSLPDISNESLECKVYTMPMWLREIYEGRKNPSKDEFDTDFEETLRKEVSKHKRDKASASKAFRNPDERLHFEIDRLMRYADRVVCGNISLFVPVLCSEGIYSKLENSVVSGADINLGVRRVEKVDYSIFYREIRTSYEEIDVPNFAVIERYTPDFILFPIYGRNAILWQDIEGKRKNTHARVLMPALIEQNLEQEILKAMAHFRWEKCRTDMGANWNNYRYPSLTSEYTDYLQFYKKNNELSQERKEKVRAQLQQCNNRHRDVFTKDYMDWILRESVGAMKLNRVSRAIMYTYCPISSEFGEGLLVQNSYKEAAKKYIMEQKRHEKSLSLLERKFIKHGRDVPEEIERTKKFLLDT